MSKVSELLEKNKIQEGSNRVTLNEELYLKLIAAVANDETYASRFIKTISEDGKITTEDRTLATEFKKVLATIIKKSSPSPITEAEAMEAAEKYQLTADQAKVLSDVVNEGSYLTTVECGKKVKVYNKPDFNITIAMKKVGKSVRPNPQDRKTGVEIAEHNTIATSHKVPSYMKKKIKIK